MVKRQKEKQYQSAREHKQNAQLRSSGEGGGRMGTVQRRLPFHCCALTLMPFTTPVCTTTASSSSNNGSNSNHGIIFDSHALTEFLLQHKKDPVTGNPLSTKDIVTLHMDQDEEGRWQCPVLTKPFTDRTRIVAILDRSSKEAYVYSHEAYKELNAKAKHWRDLTTGKKFNPKTDVLVLNDQDSEDFQKQRDMQDFWHIREGRNKKKQTTKTGTAAGTTKHNNAGTSDNNVRHSVTAMRIMEKLNDEKRKRNADARTPASSHLAGGSTTSGAVAKKMKIYSEDVTGIKYTSGKTSGSLTSTTMEVSNENASREASQEEILRSLFHAMKKMKQKGYVRMITSLGDILLELHCDIAPRTCCNFLGLCEAKKYDGTRFHRLIPGFMVQGGKAKAGEDASLWGPAFVDEFDDRLRHVGSGILSMANAGPATNKRQFFLTFKSCPHLDRKHSVFGQVADGMLVLKKLQEQETDRMDCPRKPIMIIKMEILVNPAKEAETLELERMKESAEKRMAEVARKKAIAGGREATARTSNQAAYRKPGGTGSKSIIGRYLSTHVVKRGDLIEDSPSQLFEKPSQKKSGSGKTKFGDFSSW